MPVTRLGEYAILHHTSIAAEGAHMLCDRASRSASRTLVSCVALFRPMCDYRPPSNLRIAESPCVGLDAGVDRSLRRRPVDCRSARRAVRAAPPLSHYLDPNHPNSTPNDRATYPTLAGPVTRVASFRR